MRTIVFILFSLLLTACGIMADLGDGYAAAAADASDDAADASDASDAANDSSVFIDTADAEEAGPTMCCYFKFASIEQCSSSVPWTCLPNGVDAGGIQCTQPDGCSSGEMCFLPATPHVFGTVGACP